MKKSTVAGLSVFALAMLITSAIDSIRNLPATALFGSSLIFFFFLSAIIFLIPISLISAELGASWTQKGGVYQWVKLAFGKRMAFLAIWLQWINTMVWYPTILSFIAGTLAYLINPALASQKWFLVTIILSVFWLQTILNFRGIQTSARFAAFCTIIGLIIPVSVIILLGGLWLFMHKPMQIHFTAQNLLPSLSHHENWISLTAIMAAFLGMELAAVHVNNVDNPQRSYPRALLVSVLIILTTMIFGALAIAIVLPAKQINLVDGVLQALNNFFTAYHIKWALPVLGIMILIGSFGNIINWVISPAKGLLHAAEDHFLPKFFTKTNKHGVAQNLLITQAVLVSFMCLAFLLMPSVNGSYWLLTDLSTQLYMLMYFIVFVAALVLRYTAADRPRPFKIPGGLAGMWIVTLLGLFGTVLTLVIGFFPPSGIDVGSAFHYDMVFTIGLFAMILPVVIFFWYRKYNLPA